MNETITNRIDLLDHFPKNSVCAEIGVLEGFYSHYIFEKTNPKKLYLIDKWMDEKIYKKVLKKFHNEIKEKRIIVIKGMSEDVLETFKDDFFDWVYVDGDHRYKGVLKDLEICRKKVERSGFISGHDYLSMAHEEYKYGVIEAVNHFCEEYKWQITHLTQEKWSSFVIRQKKKTFKILK